MMNALSSPQLSAKCHLHNVLMFLHLRGVYAYESISLSIKPAFPPRISFSNKVKIAAFHRAINPLFKSMRLDPRHFFAHFAFYVFTLAIGALPRTVSDMVILKKIYFSTFAAKCGEYIGMICSPPSIRSAHSFYDLPYVHKTIIQEKTHVCQYA